MCVGVSGFSVVAPGGDDTSAVAPGNDKIEDDDTARGASSTVPTEEHVVDSRIPQFQRELVRGSRICFFFDQGRHCGVYVGPSTRRADAGQGLHKVTWDDGTKEHLSRRERPQVLMVEGKPSVLFTGAQPKTGFSYTLAQRIAV